MLRSHPEAVALLGEPIEPGWMVTGSFSFNNGEGEVDITAPVSGPLGKGSLRVVGERPLNRPWEYAVRELVMDDGTVVPLE